MSVGGWEDTKAKFYWARTDMCQRYYEYSLSLPLFLFPIKDFFFIKKLLINTTSTL